jgi:hypothetical protein
MSGVGSFGDDAAVAVLTRISSVVLAAGVFAVVVAVVTAVGCVIVTRPESGAVLLVGKAVIAASLGSNGIDVVVLVFGGSVFDAVMTAFTAAMFAFELDAFSRHFFLWLRLPCPGPGILSVMQ